MKIAVTGGSGAVGRVVVQLALAEGHQVVSIDRTAPIAESANASLAFVQLELADYSTVEQALRGCEALVHLGAIPRPGRHPDYLVHNNNVVASYNALRAAAEAGITRVAQASSVNAIGLTYSRRPRFDYFPLDERHPTYCEDPYSLSKWICEQQGEAMARRFETMSIASLRFHGIVPDDRVMVRRHSPENESRPGFAGSLWGYVRIGAVARAFLLSLTAGFTGHEAFFIVAPETYLEEPSLDLARRFYPQVPVRGDLSGRRGFFDCSKAERLLGWKHDV